MKRLLLAALCAGGVPMLQAAAQASAPPTVRTETGLAFGPGVLVGRITDNAGMPLDSALIGVTIPLQRVYTNADGTFRLLHMTPGTYELAVRKLGYAPQAVSIAIDDKGGRLDFFLFHTQQRLPTVITNATRFGLSGIVMDTSRRPITNAHVQAMGANKEARTDSTGAFYLDLKPGSYMVRVSHSIFMSKMLSVRLPPDHGRSVETMMAPISDRDAHTREAFAALEMRERLVMRSAMRSRILLRDDLDRLGRGSVIDMRVLSTIPDLGTVCPAFIDGSLKTAPLWTFDPADIEVLEIYGKKPARSSGLDAALARRTQGALAPSEQCDTKTYVWLRK